MIPLLKDVWALFRGNVDAGRVVPPKGVAAWLIVMTAALMSVLAVIALAFSLTAQRIADDWAADLASSLTIRVSAPVAQLKVQTDATLAVLRSTPGIASAEVIGTEAQAILLEPWLGTGIDLDRLSLPTLIAVTEEDGGPDRDGLALRLRAEAPGAVIDDHGRWREPMIQAADRVRNIGGVVLLLALFSLLAFILLAVHAAVVSNAQNIETLRLIGARDSFIVRAFVRRITLRAVAGALLGVVMGSILVFSLQSSDGLPTAIGLSGGEWFLPAVVIPVVGLIAFFATRTSAFMALGKKR